MTDTETKAKVVQAELVRVAIELQGWGNRLLHLGPVNRLHGHQVRKHAAALARTARGMGGLGMAGNAELFNFFDSSLYLHNSSGSAGADSEGGDLD